jgi:hypothetical protein
MHHLTFHLATILGGRQSEVLILNIRMTKLGEVKLFCQSSQSRGCVLFSENLASGNMSLIMLSNKAKKITMRETVTWKVRVIREGLDSQGSGG